VGLLLDTGIRTLEVRWRKSGEGRA